jgi:hypothetical protein
MNIIVDVRVTNGEVVRQSFEDFTGEALKVGRQRLYRMTANIRSRITKAPGRFHGNWTPLTVKQWRYVRFALNRGLIRSPYQRSGAYRRSWKIVRTDEGYELQGGGYWIRGTGMRVGAPYAVLVGGDPEGKGQYYMHRGRWPLVAEVVSDSLPNIPAEIQKDLAITARRFDFPWE